MFHFFFVTETQKRRRFHPLRNLRRIFRRRSVAQADNLSPRQSVTDESISTYGSHGRLHMRSTGIDIAGTTTSASSDTMPATPTYQQHQHYRQQPLNYQPATNVLSSSASAAGGFYVIKEKRERSADSARTNKEVKSDLDREMTDYQRSLSEGRLVDR